LPFSDPAGPSTGCQHENRWSAVSPVSGGSSLRHLSEARLHLGANRQPAGSWIDRGRILPQERLLASFQEYVHAACAADLPGLS
jgi:hypothetical protein